MEENKSMKLCPPAVNLCRQIEAFFREDPDVDVRMIQREDGDATISLLVAGAAKAEALELLLYGEKTFGSQTVSIQVVPANQKESLADLYRDAFAGNPAVLAIHESEGPILDGSTFILFKPEVVQYVNDDIGDLNGIHSTLYQYLADKIFEERDGVFFNTAPTGDFVKLNLMEISGSLEIDKGGYDE